MRITDLFVWCSDSAFLREHFSETSTDAPTSPDSPGRAPRGSARLHERKDKEREKEIYNCSPHLEHFYNDKQTNE